MLNFLNKNRAFKYGDGLFETIKVSNGKALNLYLHFERLQKGFGVLQFQAEQPFTFEVFQRIINDFLSKNIPNANLRVRISFFRKGEGFYTPQEHDFEFFIETSPLESAPYQLNKKGLYIGIASQVRLSIDSLSNLKTISALPYVLAGLEKKQNNWDDCLILNSKENIAESIAANIFVVKENKLYTPSLSEGCVAGTMRFTILEIAAKLGLEIIETSLLPRDLDDAEELFLTNAIQGIQWVEKIEGLPNSCHHTLATKLTEELNLTLL